MTLALLRVGGQWDAPQGALRGSSPGQVSAYPHLNSIFGESMHEGAIVDRALTEVPRWCNHLDAFVDRLAAQRQRPIVILHLPGAVSSSTVYGAWLPTADTDYVFVAEQLSGIHRQHVVLHELGHMVLNHRPAGGGAALFDGVSGELAQRLLARHEHGDVQERQAELFASRIMSVGGSDSEWAHDPRGDRATEVFG